MQIGESYSQKAASNRKVFSRLCISTSCFSPSDREYWNSGGVQTFVGNFFFFSFQRKQKREQKILTFRDGRLLRTFCGIESLFSASWKGNRVAPSTCKFPAFFRLGHNSAAAAFYAPAVFSVLRRRCKCFPVLSWLLFLRPGYYTTFIKEQPRERGGFGIQQSEVRYSQS